MSVGGATWDTAGTLELGSGNTFTVADATEDLDLGFSTLEAVGWWTFTPSASFRVGIAPADGDIVSIRLYRGADEASKILVGDWGFEDPTTFYHAQEGVTYHLVVGTDEGETHPATYQVTFTETALAVSPPISTLYDRTDNQVIVSQGELYNENISSEFRVLHDWYADILGSVLRYPPGRPGHWVVIQTLGGPDVTSAGAVNCVWNNTKLGEDGNGGGWLGLCGGGVGDIANLIGYPSNVSWSINVPESGGPAGDSTSASITLKAEALWFGQIRTHIEERGAFNHPDPVLDGYPEDSEIEWLGDLELLKIELAGDAEERPAEDTTEDLDPLRYMLRREVAPEYLGGDPLEVFPWAHWTKGNALVWNGAKSDLSFTYYDGDAAWTEIDEVVSGPTGWEGLSPGFDSQPDEILTIGLSRSFGTPPDVDGNSRQALTAVRYTFRSPRYRWVYPGLGPVTRQESRDDGRGLSSGPRLIPASKAGRLVGGYQ